MAEEKILLSVVLDKDQLVTALTEIKTKLAENNVVAKELKEQLKNLGSGDTAGIQKLNEQLVLVEASSKKLTTSQRQLQTQLLQVNQANVAAKGSYEQIYRLWQLSQTALKTLEGTLRQNADGTLILTDAYILASKETNALKDAVDRFNLAVSDGRSNVGNYQKSLGGLTGAISSARSEHRDLGSVMQGTLGVMALLNIASGDNEKITEAQKTAMVALVVVQTLSQVKLGFLSAAQVIQKTVMKATTAATVEQSSATGILATIQTFLQAQFGLTAVAARALAIAIAATGIGLLVVGVGLLISAFQNLNTEVDDSTKSLTDQQIEIGKLAFEYLALTGQITDLEKELEILALDHEVAVTKIAKDAEEKLDRANGFFRKWFNYAKEIATFQTLNTTHLAEVAALEKAADEAKLQELTDFNLKKSIIEQKFANDKKDKEAKNAEEIAKKLLDIAKKNAEDLEAQRIDRLEKDRVLNLVAAEAEIQAVKDKNAALAVLYDTDADAVQAAINKKLKATTAGLKTNLETDKKISDANADLEAAKVEAAEQTAGALMHSFKQTSTAYKLLFAFQKGAAISQIVVKLNEEIAGIAAANSVLGAAGIPLTVAQSAAAKIRAGIGIASILATFLPAFAESGLTGKKISSRDGVRINRSNGDNLLATVKVGEVILNEQHQRLLGGDRTFRALGVPGFADGGAAVRAAMPLPDFAQTNSILDIIADKSPVVRVVDINNVQGNVSRVESNATI